MSTLFTIFRAKRQLLATLAVLAGVSALSLEAAQWLPFDGSAFKKAQTEGKTVVIDFHATWCPTCAAQRPVLEKLIGESEFKNVVAFVADFDSSSEIKKQMKVASQSTIVVFKGNREVARSTGVTNEDDLRTLLKKGL
jgi:thioredoxin-like negative regulator of GroEL